MAEPADSLNREEFAGTGLGIPQPVECRQSSAEERCRFGWQKKQPIKVYNNRGMKGLIARVSRGLAGIHVRRWDLSVPRMGRIHAGITVLATSAANPLV